MGDGGRVETGELHEEGEVLFPLEMAERKIERTSPVESDRWNTRGRMIS